jgi:hypothetical protein
VRLAAGPQSSRRGSVRARPPQLRLGRRRGSGGRLAEPSQRDGHTHWQISLLLTVRVSSRPLPTTPHAEARLCPVASLSACQRRRCRVTGVVASRAARRRRAAACRPRRAGSRRPRRRARRLAFPACSVRSRDSAAAAHPHKTHTTPRRIAPLHLTCPGPATRRATALPPRRSRGRRRRRPVRRNPARR